MNFDPEFNPNWTKIGHVTLCESGRRYQLQYRSVNPLESDGYIFIDIRFKKKYMIHRRPSENFYF